MTTRWLVAALSLLPLASEAADPAETLPIDPAVVQLWDVIYTSDGNILKGVIVEEVPGQSFRVSLVGGSLLVVPAANVTRITRELNPAFTARPAGSASAAVTAIPAPSVHASSGLRLGLVPGIAVHDEVSDSTFVLNARAGWEFALNQWGLTPGLVALYAPGTASYGSDSGSLVAAVRASYRGGSSVSPFVGFGFGGDLVSGDVSFAAVMSAGIDLIVHPKIALTGEGTFHRGFGGTYSDVMYFGSFGMGVEFRL